MYVLNITNSSDNECICIFDNIHFVDAHAFDYRDLQDITVEAFIGEHNPTFNST